MSFWSDPIGSIEGTVSGILNGIVKNPIGTALDVFLISEGIDPATAGAISGATNAAAQGANVATILKAGATGGISGLVGGYAGGATGSAIAGAAAGGATGALLSGQNPVTGAFSGAVAATVTNTLFNGRNNSVTYQFDDGSQLIYSKNDGTLLGGYDSSGNRIPDTIIQGANNGTLPTVTSATAVTPDQISDIQNTYQTMSQAGASPADIATAMAQKGYTVDQVTSVFGPDNASTVQQAYAAANAQTTAIQNTISSMQTAGNTPAEIAAALSKQGYNANQVTAIYGQSNADAIIKAFSDASAGTTNTSTSNTVTTPVVPLVSPIGNSNFIDLGSNQYLNTTTGDIVDNTGATVYKMPPGTVAGGTNLASLATDLANAGLPSDVANRAEEAINSQEATKYVNGVPDQVKVIADPEGKPTLGISLDGGKTVSYGYTVEDSNGNMYKIQSTSELNPGDVINDVIAHKGDYDLESYTPTSDTGTNTTTSNVNATSNVASVSNVANVVSSVDPNTLANLAISNIANIANISGTGNIANISVSNVANVANVSGNGTVSNVTIGNVANVANIAGNVATISNVAVSNTANIANLSGNTGNVANVVTGNVANIANLSGNTGTISNISTGNIANVANLSGNTGNVANVVTGNVSNISNLSGNTGNMANITTGNVSNLSNISGNIGNVSNVTIGNVANVANVNTHIANIANLIANGLSTNSNVSLSNVANTLSNISNITANVGNANVGNANIANANVGNANIANANVGNANVANANISNIASNVFVPIIPNSNVSNNSSNTSTNYNYTGGNVQIPIGLNPGWVTPSMYQPFYANAGAGQSNYFWGSHPFQGGNTFNSALYNTVTGAPKTPYGIQQVAGPVVPQS